MKKSKLLPWAAVLLTAAVVTPASMAQRPIGIDVSSYQGAPNWGSVKSCGWSFAWAKATEGVSINDGDYRYNINNGKSAGVYMGAYHFAHPDLNSPGSEAGHFWGVINGDIQKDGKSVQPALDFEVFSGVVSASSYSDWANQFNNAIVSDAAGKGVTVKPVLYTSSCSACNFNGSVAGWIPWIADYNGQSSQSGGPWSVCSSCDVWDKWTAWQYSSSGSVCGISGSVDVDVFNGSLSSFVSTMVIDGNGSSTFAPGPAAVSWGPNRIDVVVRGGGDAIYHKYWDGSAWQPSGGFEVLGGISAYGPGISASGVNRLDVFCASTDVSLRHKWWDGTGWFPTPHWEDLGGGLTSSPAAVSWGAGRIDVVVRGGNNNIYHKYWDGSAWQPSGGFENHGGTAVGQPAICSWGVGRLDVFYRGTGGSYFDRADGWGTGSILGCVHSPNNPATYSDPHINPCVARTSDGRLEVFAIGHSANLLHNYQTSPGGSWSGWISLGTNIIVQNSFPAVGVNADGRLEVFVVDGNGSVDHVYQKTAGSSASTNWSSIGLLTSSHVGTTAKLAVGNWGNGVLDLFVIGTDNVLYHNYQTAPNGGWGGFVSLGGSWQQDTDIALNNEKDGRLEVFLVGNTGNLYHNWQTAVNGTSWNGFSDISGALAEQVRVAVGRNSDGRLEVFTLGTDGVAYHEWETTANTPGTWGSWSSLGGLWETDAKPVVGTDQNGALEVFLIGSTGNLYHNYQASGNWSGWVDLNGSFTQSIRPCVGMNSSGKLEVFLTGPSADMQTATESAANSSTWSGYTSLGGSWN